MIDLVAVGTIADMAPLSGENRYWVKQGLKLINANPRLGIREIIAQAGLTIGSLDAESISWTIAPRLNAAGRLAHAMTSYKLLMTDSPQEARGTGDMAGAEERGTAKAYRQDAIIRLESRYWLRESHHY